MGQIDLAQLQELRENRLVVTSDHPDYDLTVCNYTAKRAIRANEWTPLLEICRGLIIDSEGTIVARPFPRMQEVRGDEPLPPGPFTAYEKLDGSMGIQYPTPEGPRIATRGSFVGRQAIRGSQLLEQYRDFPFEPGLTPLWEIIYPEGRLVIDYGERDEIVLIGLVETATGIERPLPAQADVPFPVAQAVRGPQTADELRALEVPNAEGFVVRMEETGERYKVKFPAFDYLSSIRRGAMPYFAWHRLMQGEPPEAYLETIPAAARSDVAVIVSELLEQYAEIERQAREAAENPAMQVDQRLDPIVRRIRKGLPVAPGPVWQMIRPEKDPHRKFKRYGS